MKTFRQFLEQKTKSKKYVAVIYDEETQEKLRNWCEENGFDLTKTYGGDEIEPKDFEFHTTVFYSENEINLENKTMKLTSGEAFPVKFKLLGENSDIPVLVIKSPDLKDIRSHYEALGLKDKWPEYIPHISLSYVRKKYDTSKLKQPDFRMKFGELKIEDVNENF